VPCLWHTPLTQAVGQTFMKITIDIQLALYEKMENALMSKTMRDALNDPLVMIGWHVVSARSAQQSVQRTGDHGEDCNCDKCYNDGVLLDEYLARR